MNNKAIGAVIAVVAALLITGVVVFALRETAPQPDTPGAGTGVTESHAPAGGSPASGAGGQSTSDSSVQSDTVALAIENFAFAPKEITIKQGTTITWTNKDQARHDVTPDEAKPGAPRSELLGQGESYSFTFTTAGEFNYYCSPHPYMKGKVTVVK